MTKLEKQLEFIMELDKLKHVIRKNYLADGSRCENVAEHSWHLAMMAVLLAEYANEPIDILKTVKMLLVHDIIEIDAGDTYAYDVVGNQDKKERERKAAERIFGLLPAEQAKEYRSLWDEFEEMNTAESKFANSIDKIHPFLLNSASGGKSWQEHGVRKSQVLERNKYTKDGSQALWDYVSRRIEKHTQAGDLLDS